MRRMLNRLVVFYIVFLMDMWLVLMVLVGGVVYMFLSCVFVVVLMEVCWNDVFCVF